MVMLTVLVLAVAFYHRLGGFPGDEKPFARVRQIFVLDGQVFGQYTLTLGQSVRVRAEQLIVLVLVLVVTISGRKYVVVELHHWYHASVQQILRIHDFGTRILPQSGQHVGPVHRYVGFHSEPFLGTKRKQL